MSINIKPVLSSAFPLPPAQYDSNFWRYVDTSALGPETRAIVPLRWSDNAAQILINKYFRKAGVPGATVQVGGFGASIWSNSIHTSDAKFGPETSAHQVFHRLAGCWTHWGLSGGHLSGDQAQTFYNEIYLSLYHQLAAPNSPQWFNTGLYWAYGIDGPDSGQWITNDEGKGEQIHTSYVYPQPHACFIQPVSDDLVNPGGIMDLFLNETRLFKHGSGTGSNFSSIRGKGEKLSGGGRSSGLLSFLKIGDRAAGSIKSGGVTRRAAKMVIVNADHPDIEEFIDWKMREEEKAAAIAVGSQRIKDHLETIHSNQIQYEDAEESINDALEAGVPQALIDRTLIAANRGEPFEWKTYQLGFESEAEETISGQNANNSVRVTDDFMTAVDHDIDWNLIARTTGETTRSVSARDLWQKVINAAWACGDPGIQFDTTINDWHTCPADGRINASNPCSEYMFLDDTACNLASINLVTTLIGDDYSIFKQVVKLYTIVLDISITMASFPSKAVAENTYKYRTLGLGYANLGAYLMRRGVSYDSVEGREIAAGLTSFMTGLAYKTSGQLALAISPFPRWRDNAEDMKRVLKNHAIAAGIYPSDEYRGLSKIPDQLHLHDRVGLAREIEYAWDWVINVAPRTGFRNAQVTLLAPTGTISFVMDCDTTGIEPMMGLTVYKTLAGGGSMQLENASVTATLDALGYDQARCESIREHIRATGTIEGSDLNPAHLPIFDGAFKPQNGKRFLSATAHVLMVAAVQPHLSGAVSKTINLPNHATPDDLDQCYWLAWRLGCKAIAPYRDGSKLSQPHTTDAPKLNREEIPSPADLRLALNLSAEHGYIYSENPEKPFVAFFSAEDTPESTPEPTPTPPAAAGTASGGRGVRHPLPARRNGYSQKVKIDGQTLYYHTGEYADGSFGEVFVNLSKEGSTMRSLMEGFGKAISIGIQYGVPLHEYVEAFIGTRFEPSGIVENHESIKFASSIFDLIFRDLAIEYLKEYEHANVKPAPDPLAQFVIDTINTKHPEAYVLSDFVPSNQVFNSTSYSTGQLCPQCQNPTLQNVGTCKRCVSPGCMFDTGCG